MADNQTTSNVNKYYQEANRQIDEQSILDKYNAVTAAQYNIQREQNRQAENQFYNQMYNTQQTAMDTIRQANAAAVSSGASRGVQAANELSAILGLEQESVQSATELAQANRQTAQEETAAVLENVLNAYQEAQQERQNYVQSAIQQASIEAQQEQNRAQQEQANIEAAKYKMDLKVNDPEAYNRLIASENNATDFANMTDAQYNTNVQNAAQAINEYTSTLTYNWNDFADWDFGEKGSNKINKIATQIRSLYTSYGLSESDANALLKEMNSVAKSLAKQDYNTGWANSVNNVLSEYAQSKFKLAYAKKYSDAHAAVTE